MSDRKEGYVVGLRTNGNLAFLCDRCGKVHFHGVERGHRVAHCRTETGAKFGDHYEGYFLNESEQLQGFLDSQEANTLAHLSRVAHVIVCGMQKFLDIAEIDPASAAALKVAQAHNALEALASIHADRENPFEALVDETKTRAEDC